MPGADSKDPKAKKSKTKASAKNNLAQEILNELLAEEIAPTTNFSAEEVKAFLQFYDKLVERGGKMDRMRFREFLHSTFEFMEDLMMDLTFKAVDTNGDGVIDASEFVRGICVMMRADPDEIIKFVYSVYDMNGDGGLAREEVAQCLKGCIQPGFGLDPDEIDDGERELVEAVMRKLDTNRDGVITFDDFHAAVLVDPLLLQALGPCLVAPRVMARFLYTVTWDYRNYTSEMLDNKIIEQEDDQKASVPRTSMSRPSAPVV